MQNITPVIDDDVCRNCRRCLARRACRPKAIVHIDADEFPFVNAARCQGCLICLPACPFGAVQKSIRG